MSFALYAVTKDGEILFKGNKQQCEKFYEKLVSKEMKLLNIWKVQSAKNKKVGDKV